jgi:CRISPR/Cas system CSM-associated protein Csm3 (group 7 of RAMP superfamily)
MPEIRFTITLETDAEPGTGLGTELINDMVPRRNDGTPFLPASHLKGLLRESVRGIASQLGWPAAVETHLFGDEGRDGGDGQQGLLRVSDAVAASTSATGIATISRTALNDFGTARAGTLRTVECIAAGTAFRGTVQVLSGADQFASDAARLALLSLTAIGGNRTRGAGNCSVALDGEPLQKPSAVLRRLDAAVRTAPLKGLRFERSSSATPSSSRATFLQLTFHAHDPVCCPTVPVTGTNVMRSGFAIPASAVQGAILHLLDRADHESASRMFASPAFRAWPLLPCAAAGDDPGETLPVWTSLTHRMSKSAAGPLAASSEPPFFRDKLIAPFDWREVPSGAPLKGADGVLLASKDGVRLWRASDMPRQLSAHVNLQGPQPQLFTVQAMAPMVFRGILAVPEEFEARILELLSAEPNCAFGKARTVRGGGTLRAVSLRDASPLPPSHSASTFVVQSPLAIPHDWLAKRKDAMHGGEILRQLVESAGFGAVEQAEATLEYRFGWSRHGAGQRIAHTNRLAAEAVIAPGSAFKLAVPVAERGRALFDRLAKGIGEGRDRGFGAVLPHPGIASEVFRGAPKLAEIKSRDSAGKLATELTKLSAGSELSASAISQLVQFARGGPKPLEDFIARQKQRPSRNWQRWKHVAERLLEITRDKSITDETRARAFRGWTDAVNAKGGLS